MKTTYRLDYRTWVPDFDGDPNGGHAAERTPRFFDTISEAQRAVLRIDRFYDGRITRVDETVIWWKDPRNDLQ